MSSYRSYNRGNHSYENVTEGEYKALLELKANENLVIQKGDKGNIVVILDKETYLERMKSILDDEQKFLHLGYTDKQALDALIAIEQRIKKHLLPLKEKNVIDETVYSKITPVGTQPGKLYGLCKVHKEPENGCPPFRPIISAINTPTYYLAKFLLPILEPITKNNFVIKDRFSFVENLKNEDSHHVMASFDVESLFTNIPLDETIEICVNKLYTRRNMKIKGMTKSEFKDLLQLATKESLFIFNRQYFKQLDGVAMGSPLGPTLANIFLCHHEEIWLNCCPAQFKPVYYKRYVDDTFLLFRDEDHIKKFDKYLNSRHVNMRFTYQIESDKSLNFLDVFIQRNDDFVTSIYRKPTFSGIYSHYDSYLPLTYKKGLISSLMFRIFHLSSNWSIIHDEMQNLKVFLMKNKYPQRFVDSSICKILEKLIVRSKSSNITTDKKEYIICLPFISQQSLALKKRLTKLFSTTYPKAKLKTIFKSGTKLGNLFSFKDRSPFIIQSLVLYQFSCSSCNATYIGKTKRHLLTRTCEHLGISKRTGKCLKYNAAQATVVQQHLLTSSHQGDIDNFKVLGYARNDFELLIKESLIISKLDPSLNKQTESFRLQLF